MGSVSKWRGIAGCDVSFTRHTWIDVHHCMQMIPAGRRASVTVVHFRRHRWRCSRRKGCCCGASIDGRNYAQAADHLSSDTIAGVHCSLPPGAKSRASAPPSFHARWGFAYRRIISPPLCRIFLLSLFIQ
jgi:hypothetical protein